MSETMQRLLRPSDVYEATTWFLGVEPAHDTAGRATRRRMQAKSVYWGALIEIGFNQSDISREVKVDRSTIRYVLEHYPAVRCYTEAVLAKAREMVEAE